MSFEDQRGMSPNHNRKPMQQKYGSYGYGHNTGYSGNSNFNGNSGYNGNSSYNSGNSQTQRRRPAGNGGFKPQSNNNDRLIRQNDTIIKLLKEIRDRLPAPAVDPMAAVAEEMQKNCQTCDCPEGECQGHDNEVSGHDQEHDDNGGEQFDAEDNENEMEEQAD